MSLYQNLIAGEWIGSDPSANVNPSDTNDVVGKYSRGSARDMTDTIDMPTSSSPQLRPHTRWHKGRCLSSLGRE